ncbi:MAG: branched-chain amino acid ABC transporter permease [Clostridia bacterium]|jgi:branched-chain amino acid transport system permease protein|nr:branched-chain amino acid ABC transporter permease [Clostridia bacterium]MDH7573092.1 branched-chain amino acid ABC transporter permease [Clostridia bacterium]
MNQPVLVPETLPARKWLPWTLLVAAAVILTVVPLFGGKYVSVFLSNTYMYVVLTVSWIVFSGATRYVSLASAAFFGIGVYTAALLGMKVPIYEALLVGGLISFAFALLVGGITLRLRGIYFAMFTLGLVQFVGTLLRWAEVHFSGRVGRLVPYMDYLTVYYLMYAILLAVLVVSFLINRSRFGLALRSIGECEEAAEHVGINTTWAKVLAFAISAFFMGASGVVMASRWTYVDPTIAFNLQLSFMPVLMAVFGGMGQLYGPVIGAAVFTYLEDFLITRFPYFYMLIFGCVMVVTILYLPEGLVGLIQKWLKRERGR